MMSPLPVNESFTIPCPLDVNPKPLIELLMQGRYRLVPPYDYARSDAQSLRVTVGASRPTLTLSVRQKKGVAMGLLVVMLLVCQFIVLQKRQHQRLERYIINTYLSKAETSKRSLKMYKALKDLLRVPIYIRKVEVTPEGWFLDIMGEPTQLQALSSRWTVILPMDSTPNGLTIIKGGGTWATKY